MTHTYRELLRFVRSRWFRWQSWLARCYTERVTQPVQLWVAVGRPVQWRPQLPWWQPFVWRWLVFTGWVRVSRRSER